VPYIEAAGAARIYYEIEGEGPSVLLVHGGTGTSEYDWELQRDQLSEDYRLVLMDMRGHGRSNDPEWLLGIEQIGKDVVQLVDELGERPAAIIAFSVGASAVMRLLALEPDLTDAFVTIGPSPSPKPERVTQIDEGPWPQELIELRHEHGDVDHWRRLRSRLVRSVWRDPAPMTDDELARIAMPTLVVAGDRDSIEPVETAVRICRALPRGELLVLPGAGHFAHRDRPEEFNAVVERFLARHLPR
jgi:pimeloyl-ACP methyl ester carboxylesterase